MTENIKYSAISSYWNAFKYYASNPGATGSFALNALASSRGSVGFVDQMHDANHFEPGINAVTHAMTSTWMTLAYGAESARQVGVAHEFQTYQTELAKGDFSDKYKDMYNNNIGRQIGLFARENGLSSDQASSLVLDAYSRGLLIRALDDPRIDSKFNGDPLAFDESLVPTWVNSGVSTAEQGFLTATPYYTMGYDAVLSVKAAITPYAADFTNLFSGAADVSPGEYLIGRVQTLEDTIYGPSFQSDTNSFGANYALNTTGTMNDAGFGDGQLTVFGSGANDSFTSLTSNGWGSPALKFGFDGAGTALSTGSTRGTGGYNVGTLDTYAFNTTPAALDFHATTGYVFDAQRAAAAEAAAQAQAQQQAQADAAAQASASPAQLGYSSPDGSVSSSPTLDYVGNDGFHFSDILKVVFDGKGGGGDTGGGGDAPVIFDLTGNGPAGGLPSGRIKITPLGSSNTFFDMAGDGYQHVLPKASKRTVWLHLASGTAASTQRQRDVCGRVPRGRNT